MAESAQYVGFDMERVPSEYRFIRRGPAVMAVKKKYEQVLLRQGLADPERLVRSIHSAVAPRRGRGAVVSMPIGDSSTDRMVFRKYLRGGVIRFVNRDVFWGRARPFRELAVTVCAADRGVPVPDILAAVSVNVFGPFWRGYLVSKDLQSYRDLPCHLRSVLQNNKDGFVREKRALLRTVAKTVRSMHDSGVLHGDLNLKNILVDGSNPGNICIIDWDKSRAQGRIARRQRQANVVRCCRSMAKLARSGTPVTPRDRFFFLVCYWDDRQQARRDYRRLKLSLAVRKVLWPLLGGSGPQQ